MAGNFSVGRVQKNLRWNVRKQMYVNEMLYVMILECFWRFSRVKERDWEYVSNYDILHSGLQTALEIRRSDFTAAIKNEDCLQTVSEKSSYQKALPKAQSRVTRDISHYTSSDDDIYMKIISLSRAI